VSAIVLLLAATAFYIAVRPLPGALDSPTAIEAEPPPAPTQP